MSTTQETFKYPTPIPQDLAAKPIVLPDNCRTILERRYLRKDDNGKAAETIPEMYWRVASYIASRCPENQKPGSAETVMQKARTYYDLISTRRFSPNSPTFTGAGTALGQLAACFVLAIDDDMGKDSEEGIFSTLRSAALIQQTGGGVGFSFSRLRQAGALVQSSKGSASGPLSFLKVYDAAFGAIAQGGTRRGANMGVLRVDHPDIEAFIGVKDQEGVLTNFNLSVGITDTFMRAVESGSSFDLLDPRTKEVVRSVDARALFDKIVSAAHKNGEPGVLFLDTANAANPVPHLYTLESTNPCGEQFLGPYENCCLGSLNLGLYVEPKTGKIHWDDLARDIRLATEFLDDVVDANNYVPAVPKLREAAQRVRRIGVGIMGLADLAYACKAPYGSKKARDLGSMVVEFVRYHTMLRSIELAQERGSFPGIKGSVYDPENFTWKHPVPMEPYDESSIRAFARPPLDWNKVYEGIRAHGIRNGAQTTIAPTGTIGTVAGCEGYGCEPVFALAYKRLVHEADGDKFLDYVSPLFLSALDVAGITGDRRAKILEIVNHSGSCSSVPDELLSKEFREVFSVAGDIPAEQHILMQAALQRFVDSSISKTINLPFEATVDDVKNAYMLAWKSGCKGTTVYRDGSRHGAVLETKATKEKQEKEDKKAQAAAEVPERSETPSTECSDMETSDSETPEKPAPAPVTSAPAEPAPSSSAPGALRKPTLSSIPYLRKRERPPYLRGVTFRSVTPLGDAYVTVNVTPDGDPFEVFLNVGKGGSDVSAVSEALGRLISLILRTPSMYSPNARLGAVVEQLKGIGGHQSKRVGRQRILSLPDAIAKALDMYMKEEEERRARVHFNDEPDILEDVSFSQPARLMSAAPTSSNLSTSSSSSLPGGDFCPECQNFTLRYTEGCRKCTTCGHSEC